MNPSEGFTPDRVVGSAFSLLLVSDDPRDQRTLLFERGDDIHPADIIGPGGTCQVMNVKVSDRGGHHITFAVTHRMMNEGDIDIHYTREIKSFLQKSASNL